MCPPTTRADDHGHPETDDVCGGAGVIGASVRQDHRGQVVQGEVVALHQFPWPDADQLEIGLIISVARLREQDTVAS
ncbi:hypothetical protein [Actinomycetospora chiangmaiensis]|uniref:hypothetical protein n=1 Tax=Actinomycetospora chiangmaiensis TaxID=402650 RepID=UPI00039B2C25|nr:hypothetical protein [Actinomycetospora chiangmaiensis]